MKIKVKFQKLIQSKTLQNIMKMISGTLIGQIISILMVPFVSRLYGAELYGDLAVFNSISAVCTSFLGFGMTAAIMVGETDEKAQQAYKISVSCTTFLIIIIAGTLLCLRNVVQIMNISMPYGVSICLLAFAIITANQTNLLYAWLNRKGRYNVLLFNPIIMPLVNYGLVFLFGVTGLTNVGLYVGMLVSQGVALLHMFVKMDKMEYKFRIKDIPKVIKRNHDFILYLYPSDIINNIVGNLPVQIISVFFGNTVVGYYSMAMKLLNIPSNILASSVSRIFIKEATDKEREGINVREYTLKVSIIIIGIFMIPVACILLLGEEVIPWVLGIEWEASVIYIKIMALWNLFAIAINCTAGFPTVIHKQKSCMIVSIVKLVLFPTFMIGLSYVFYNPIVTVLAYAAIYSIINAVYYELLIRKDGRLKNKYLLMNILFLFLCIVVECLGKLIELILLKI